MNGEEKSLLVQIVGISDLEEPIDHFCPHFAGYLMISKNLRLSALFWSFWDFLFHFLFFRGHP